MWGECFFFFVVLLFWRRCFGFSLFVCKMVEFYLLFIFFYEFARFFRIGWGESVEDITRLKLNRGACFCFNIRLVFVRLLVRVCRCF